MKEKPGCSMATQLLLRGHKQIAVPGTMSALQDGRSTTSLHIKSALQNGLPASHLRSGSAAVTSAPAAARRQKPGRPSAPGNSHDAPATAVTAAWPAGCCWLAGRLSGPSLAASLAMRTPLPPPLLPCCAASSPDSQAARADRVGWSKAKVAGGCTPYRSAMAFLRYSGIGARGAMSCCT